MPELDEISYSRDKTIDAIRNYFYFLSKLYLNKSLILEPPEGGWPSITQDNLRGLGKTDKVIDLLRHLPYVRATGSDADAVQVAPECPFADWQFLASTGTGADEDDDGLRVCTEGPELYENVPPHVVSLTTGGGLDDPPIFLLDTELGIVHWYQCPGEIKHNSIDDPDLPEAIDDDVEDYAPENEQEWRGEAPAWAIADFFELLKHQFRCLNFIPINSTEVKDAFVSPGKQPSITALQDIYRAHGWPDEERYHKEECLAAVRNALGRN